MYVCMYVRTYVRMSGVRSVESYFILFTLFCMNINNTFKLFMAKVLVVLIMQYKDMVSIFKVVSFNLFSRVCVRDWRCELC